RRRRITSLLQRRGYDLDAIQAALSEHEDALNQSAEPSPRMLARQYEEETSPEQGDAATPDELYDDAQPVQIVTDTSFEDALALVEKKLAQPSMQKADANARRRRLSGMLARRGHHYDIIQKVFEAAGV
ncbi:MAG: hypothetical protein ACYTGQ_17405, partial [Planctomycetota bacterium]